MKCLCSPSVQKKIRVQAILLSDTEIVPLHLQAMLQATFFMIVF